MAPSARPVRAVPSLLTNTTPWRAFPHTPLTLSNPKAKYCSSLRLPLPYPPLLSHIRSRRTITSLLLLPAQGTALLPRATYSSHARPPPPSPHDIIFSADQPADLPHRALKLFPDWQLTGSRKGVVRQFTFSSFTKAWRFMSLIADECKAKNHHPSWSNLYNRVTIEWTTHSPNGLSTKDVEMAEFCNQKAVEIGLKQ